MNFNTFLVIHPFIHCEGPCITCLLRDSSGGLRFDRRLGQLHIHPPDPYPRILDQILHQSVLTSELLTFNVQTIPRTNNGPKLEQSEFPAGIQLKKILRVAITRLVDLFEQSGPHTRMDG